MQATENRLGRAGREVEAMSEKIGTMLRAHCSNCGDTRNCEVKGHHANGGGDDEGHYSWHSDWYLLVCRGCDHVFAQSVSTNSDDYHQYYDQNGEAQTEHYETVEMWPARSKRKAPEWFEHAHVDTDIPNTNTLDASLKELYGALNSGLPVLASIGIRTSFDIAAELLDIDPAKSFAEKLTDLVDGGHILEAEKVNIETLIEAGSASAHRGWQPHSSEVDTLMNALEDFIYSSMVFPAQRRAKEAKLAALKKRVPIKPKRRKKGEDVNSADGTDQSGAK
jgi:hypothetical protein